jgi:hypothetical protein
MDMISLQRKTNFFEGRVAEYRKAGVKTTEEEKSEQEDVFGFSDEF